MSKTNNCILTVKRSASGPAIRVQDLDERQPAVAGPRGVFELGGGGGAARQVSGAPEIALGLETSRKCSKHQKGGWHQVDGIQLLKRVLEIVLKDILSSLCRALPWTARQ